MTYIIGSSISNNNIIGYFIQIIDKYFKIIKFNCKFYNKTIIYYYSNAFGLAPNIFAIFSSFFGPNSKQVFQVHDINIQQYRVGQKMKTRNHFCLLQRTIK